MSTNYYVRTTDTAPDGEGIHLGQSANNGFTFRAHPDLGVTTYEAWTAQLATGQIVTEYGSPLTPEEMIAIADRPDRKATWAEVCSSFSHGFYDEAGRRWLTVEFC